MSHIQSYFSHVSSALANVTGSCVAQGSHLKNFCQPPNVKENLIQIFQNFTQAFNRSYYLIPIEASLTLSSQLTKDPIPPEQVEKLHSISFGIIHSNDFLTQDFTPGNKRRGTYYDKILCRAGITIPTFPENALPKNDWKLDCENGYCIYPSTISIDLSEHSIYNSIASQIDPARGEFPSDIGHIFSRRAEQNLLSSNRAPNCRPLTNPLEVRQEPTSELIDTYLQEGNPEILKRCLGQEERAILQNKLLDFSQQKIGTYSFSSSLTKSSGNLAGNFLSSAFLNGLLINYQEEFLFSLIETIDSCDSKLIFHPPTALSLDPTNPFQVTVRPEKVLLTQSIHTTPESSASADSTPSLSGGAGLAIGAFALYQASKKISKILEEKRKEQAQLIKDSAVPGFSPGTIKQTLPASTKKTALKRNQNH